MTRVILDHVVATFGKRIGICLRLADSASSFRTPQGARFRPIPETQKYLIIELAFLQLFLSLEDFIEQTFMRYMCGAASSSGYRPHRYAIPKDIRHALRIVRQARPYVDWTNWENLIGTARTIFRDGAPFADPLRASLRKLNEMKTIRNRIAHCSELSQRKYQELLQDRFGLVPRNMTPGRLLQHTSQTGTVLQEYAEVLLILGRGIAS